MVRRGRLRWFGHLERKCVDEIPVDSVGLKEVSIGQNDKLECFEKFCYLGDMIGSEGGSEEAARVFWSENVWMNGCLLAEFLRCQVIRVEAGVGKLRDERAEQNKRLRPSVKLSVPPYK